MQTDKRKKQRRNAMVPADEYKIAIGDLYERLAKSLETSTPQLDAVYEFIVGAHQEFIALRQQMADRFHYIVDANVESSFSEESVTELSDPMELSDSDELNVDEQCRVWSMGIMLQAVVPLEFERKPRPAMTPAEAQKLRIQQILEKVKANVDEANDNIDNLYELVLKAIRKFSKLQTNMEHNYGYGSSDNDAMVSIADADADADDDYTLQFPFDDSSDEESNCVSLPKDVVQTALQSPIFTRSASTLTLAQQMQHAGFMGNKNNGRVVELVKTEMGLSAAIYTKP